MFFSLGLILSKTARLRFKLATVFRQKVEPTFDMHTETLFLRNAFALIFNCIQVYFEPCLYLNYQEPNAQLTAAALDISLRLVIFNDSQNCLTIHRNYRAIIHNLLHLFWFYITCFCTVCSLFDILNIEKKRNWLSITGLSYNENTTILVIKYYFEVTINETKY